MYQIPLIFLLLLLSFPVPSPPGPMEVPAVIVVYDPDLCYDGEPINCDDDPTTVASGPRQPWMYGAAGACDRSLMGGTVHFPGIDFSMKCVDTGGMIRVMWSEYYQRYVLYFDAMAHLEKEEDGTITGAPYWNYWLIEDWYVTWD